VTRVRPSWHDTWLAVAESVSRRALCGCRAVGAVLVDGSNRIISTGYNGPPAGFDHRGLQCQAWCERAATGESGDTYDRCPSVHAEVNALLYAVGRTAGSTLYVTSAPCLGCAKAIAASGVMTVVLPDGERGKRADAEDLLRSCGIDIQRL